MKIKYPRAKPYFSKSDRKDIISKIDNILETGQIAQGKYVSEFEDSFKEKIGTRYGIATNSCTSALEISIRALGIKDNDDVKLTTKEADEFKTKQKEIKDAIIDGINCFNGR